MPTFAGADQFKVAEFEVIALAAKAVGVAGAVPRVVALTEAVAALVPIKLTAETLKL